MDALRLQEEKAYQHYLQAAQQLSKAREKPQKH
jgi:DNA repair ATPase RecN